MNDAGKAVQEFLFKVHSGITWQDIWCWQRHTRNVFHNTLWHYIDTGNAISELHSTSKAILTSKQGLYSQVFNFFITYEWPNKLESHITLGWNGYPGTNTIAYWAHSKVCCDADSVRPEPHSTSKSTMEQHIFKNMNNCLNINIYSYLETSGGLSSNPYFNFAHFFNTRVD